MYQPPIVNFPVFSITWSESTHADGATSTAVLTAGGGGAGNTGVGNKISLIAFNGSTGKPSHTTAFELETSPETCNCVASSDSGQIVAGAFGKDVRIYANNPSGFHKLAHVQADFAARESGINSMAFSPRDGGGENGVLLATGGEDCTLRVWELSADRSGGGGGDEPSLAVQLVGECKGHKKPITCVRFHPSSRLVLTASKDGACRLWDWRRGTQAALLTTTSGLPATVLAPVVMCRACSFSPTKPDTIFTVQSGPRGSAYVTEWSYTVEQAVDGGVGEITCAVKPVKVTNVSKYPATTLSVRSDGARLAVGNVEGTVTIYRLPGMGKVMEHPVHDLPVTGLSFTQGTAGATLGGYDLVASSADYKITFFKSQGSAVTLALKKILVFIWSSIVFLFASIFWLLRTLISVALFLIPVTGLLVLGAAVIYKPEELARIVKSVVYGEDDGVAGLEDVVDQVTPVV